VPLGRKNTRYSLASEIIEHNAGEDKKKKRDLGLPYLFMRMGKLNRQAVQSLLQARIFYSWYGSIKCVDRSSQLREWCTLSLVLFMVSRFCPAISLQGLK